MTDADRPPYTPFFGAMGATAAMAFSGKENFGVSYDNRKLMIFYY